MAVRSGWVFTELVMSFFRCVLNADLDLASPLVSQPGEFHFAGIASWRVATQEGVRRCETFSFGELFGNYCISEVSIVPMVYISNIQLHPILSVMTTHIYW